jgi:2-polyprenyl-3-methyl-5-hydroxy-6-metoxy-1,4-benzoquinol methylase
MIFQLKNCTSDLNFGNDTKTALEAQYEAQKIAFAPIIFQVARSMRDFGILKALCDHHAGLTLAEIADNTSLSLYSTSVLLESALSADIVKINNERYYITKTGFYLQNDKITNINMNYNHYVNYQGLYYLDESLKQEKAIGLQRIFNGEETIYPILSTLPDKAKQSWFEFDHYYSDSAFPDAINLLLEMKPKNFLDIGGNTGKFSMLLAKSGKDISITIIDLEEQIQLAKESIKKNNLEGQIDFISMSMLDDSKKIPQSYDVIWMSQFLDCFREKDIITILRRVKNSMSKYSKLCIMEPLWDKQRFETSAYCIINTSPYFSALANGYSKMFHSEDIKHYIKEAGLKVTKEIHNLGICQSIIICE